MTIAEKLQTIAENEQKVYNAGFEKGKGDVWDIIQDNGKRTDYNHFFKGLAWTAETFIPKYPLKPITAYRMFEGAGITTSEYIKSIDFSACQALVGTFYSSQVTELGVIDCRSAVIGWGGVNQTFYECRKLTKIEKIIPPLAGLRFECFQYCEALRDITFEGEIASGGLSLVWSKSLSKASIESLINALSTNITDKLNVTLSKTAVCTSFETSNPDTCQEWLKLIEPKLDYWTISLSDI